MPSCPLKPGREGGGGGGRVMEKITIVYWKWDINSLSLHGEDSIWQMRKLRLREVSRLALRSHNWCMAEQGLHPRPLRRQSLSSSWLHYPSELIPPSRIPQLLIALLPLRNGADCATQPCTPVGVSGSFCSGLVRVSLHSPQPACRRFEAMGASWSPLSTWHSVQHTTALGKCLLRSSF